MNRAKLLAAALTCLQEKGYAGTTARDLVEASGTNLASIGYHFGSKDALLNEAIAHGMTLWTAEVEREMFAAADASLEERLERALAAMLDRFGEYEPQLRAFVEGFPPALHSEELRSTLAAAYRTARAAGAEMLQRAGADELAPSEAKTLASLVLAVCDGLILQWLLDPESAPSSSEVMAALRQAAAIHQAE